MKKYSILLLILLSLLSFNTFSQTLAFPTAEGFGAYATGGRGGKVVAVTNLEDDDLTPPEGSFRWALQQHPGEPIIIVFKVSGVINLAPYVNNARRGELKCKRNNFTIAGQTAPGDGICIKGNKVNFGGSTNFIIRHMRFRIGIMLDGEGNPHAAGNGSIGIENASNFIVDHCTFGWSGEENMTVYDNDKTTVQWCIVHEGLYRSGHNKGDRGYGSQWGGQNATYHHNLLAHNYSRSPRFNGARSNDVNVLLDFVNNVNYNWGKQNAPYGGDIDAKGKTHRANIVNNYYKPGPARPVTNSSYFVEASYHGEQTPDKIAVWWMSGNIMEGKPAWNDNNYLGLNKERYPAESRDKLEASAHFEISHPVTTETAEEAFVSVLAGAGAFPRDAVDTRIVEEVRTGTASGSGARGQNLGIIDDPEAVGGYPTYVSTESPLDSDGDGMPDAWEIEKRLNPNDAADGNKVTKSGYTAFEVYLNGLVGEDIPLEFDDLSIEKEKSDNNVKVFLNKGFLTIESDKPLSKISVYNTIGQLMVTKPNTMETLDMSDFISGTYIVKVLSTDNNEYIFKVLK